jgi:hypothetical protein
MTYEEILQKIEAKLAEEILQKVEAKLAVEPHLDPIKVNLAVESHSSAYKTVFFYLQSKGIFNPEDGSASIKRLEYFYRYEPVFSEPALSKDIEKIIEKITEFHRNPKASLIRYFDEICQACETSSTEAAVLAIELLHYEWKVMPIDRKWLDLFSAPREQPLNSYTMFPSLEQYHATTAPKNDETPSGCRIH